MLLLLRVKNRSLVWLVLAVFLVVFVDDVANVAIVAGVAPVIVAGITDIATFDVVASLGEVLKLSPSPYCCSCCLVAGGVNVGIVMDVAAVSMVAYGVLLLVLMLLM